MGEIDKTATVTVQATINIKFILADAEPECPTGYERLFSWDFDLGQLGKLWAFKEIL